MTAQPQPRPSAKVGQVWASTHAGDTRRGLRQRRHVVDVDESFVYLKTEGAAPTTRVRRNSYGGIPGHRLVEEGP